MAHGGKRKGAGRKPWKKAAERAASASVKLPPKDLARLRAVARALKVSQAAVLMMGIDAAERKLARREKEG